MTYFPVYKPYLNKEILKYAHDALDSTWISSTGKYLDLAKELLQQIINIKYLILVGNGTQAMHLVAKALRFKYHSIDTIIVPNNVYVAAWNAFMFDRPNLMFRHTDTDLKTWNMDLGNFEENKYNSYAALIVHNLGNVINVPELKSRNINYIFVEDACEALGGFYNNKSVGTESLCSALSFYGNKNFTSGEGGAFLTQDEDIYNYIKKVYSQHQSDTKFIHDGLGYNYRMTNIQAAILYGQLKYWDEILERKSFVFNEYKKRLNSFVSFQKEEENTKHSHWMVGIRIENNPNYEKIEEFFGKRGIETRPFFYPINRHQHLRSQWGSMKNAELLSKEVFILPSYPELTNSDIKYISNCVKEYLHEISR